LEQLGPDDFERIAERVAPLIAARLPQAAPIDDGWLNAKAAAAYLGVTLDALYKHTSARAIPFEQDGPGCKLWFRRDELDRWRGGQSPSG
jgi:excisionase family DNA binding protein